MSGMKSKLRLHAMFAAMAMGDIEYSENSKYRKLTKEEKLKAIAEKEKMEQLKQQGIIEQLKRKGVKEYFYGQNVIYARNKKMPIEKLKIRVTYNPYCGSEANVLKI